MTFHSDSGTNPEPKFVAATLKWCNKMRAKVGKKPLKRLPKGEMGDSASCPCGKATGLSVFFYSYHDESKDGCGNIPQAVSDFVIAFDSGRFPQYKVRVNPMRQKRAQP